MPTKNKMTFKGYYDLLANQNPQTELRDKICAELDIPSSTFYYKMQKDKFSKLEKERVIEIIEKDEMAKKLGVDANSFFTLI